MDKFHINNVFWTFQGEGFHSGRRALFIRMPFCNLKCPWCDTEFNSFQEWDELELFKVAGHESARFAVITGGEPTMHKHTPKVIELLKTLHFEIAIETNGNFPIPSGIDFVTVSPKSYAEEPYSIHPDAWAKASEFKYVVEDGFDFKLLDRHDTSDGRRYSLSPEFGTMEWQLKKIMDYVAQHPKWRISLQTHKWMGIP